MVRACGNVHRELSFYTITSLPPGVFDPLTSLTYLYARWKVDIHVLTEPS